VERVFDQGLPVFPDVFRPVGFTLFAVQAVAFESVGHGVLVGEMQIELVPKNPTTPVTLFFPSAQAGTALIFFSVLIESVAEWIASYFVSKS